MILWNSKTKVDTEMANVDYVGVRHFRTQIRVLEYDNKTLTFFSYHRQVKFHADKPESKWCDSQVFGSFMLNFDRFKFGRVHMYYDGCHTGYDFGPFHYYHQPDGCKECFPD